MSNLSIIEKLLDNYYHAIRNVAACEQCGTQLEIELAHKEVAIAEGKIMKFFYENGYDANK